MHLNPEMTDQKLELLLRSALVEDAENVNERLAALMADITVYRDDGEIVVCLSVDLWPEDKFSPSLEAIAKMFSFNIEWEGSGNDFPFAWPGIGEFHTSTPKFMKQVLDAYRDQGGS